MCDIFTSGIINDQRFTSAEATLSGFIRSPQVRQLYDTVQRVYPNLIKLEKDFTQAFKFYKYYFPKKNIPQVVSYISEYTFGTFPYKDSLVGVGLDFFLGAKHTGYAFAEIPSYVTRSFDETHLLAKCMEGIATDLVDAPVGNRLLDVMIHNGKKLYVLDKFLPNSPDSVKLDYTQLQVEWCKANEAEVWAHLLTEKLLYSSKQSDWTKLVNPSPVGTTKMPAQSPGRVGNWMGYRILKAYMKRHPNTSLEQLLALRDAQKILDESKYKPKRK
jgi:hypothetical protein